MSTFVIVDISNLFMRCRHVVQGDIDLKTGQALHIIMNSLRAVTYKFPIDHMVFAVDHGSWRKAIYPEYKAHRRFKEAQRSPIEMEEDKAFRDTLNALLTYIKEKTNVTILDQKNCEADDFVARWIQLHPDDDHVILSSDSDFFQLLADNVKIFDGMKNWTITKTGVFDEQGKQAIKKKTITEEVQTRTGLKKKKVTKLENVPAPDPEYELFKKIIRGDASDNILGSYPGAREAGSSKKPGIREAFEDRHKRGFDWTMFMENEWKDHNGNKVRVLDAYKFNKTLIDLTQQPDEIKTAMDEKIIEACQAEPKGNIGLSFLRFCHEMRLDRIKNDPNDYVKFLKQPYAK
jgi:5'-3' exonuclease